MRITIDAHDVRDILQLPKDTDVEFEGPLDDVAWIEGMKKLIKNGLKLQLIKGVREASGIGLKEAKDIVDDLCSRSPVYNTCIVQQMEDNDQ